jgi:hypothetical protein
MVVGKARADLKCWQPFSDPQHDAQSGSDEPMPLAIEIAEGRTLPCGGGTTCPSRHVIGDASSCKRRSLSGGIALRSWETAVINCACANGFWSRMLLVSLHSSCGSQSFGVRRRAVASKNKAVAQAAVNEKTPGRNRGPSDR